MEKNTTNYKFLNAKDRASERKNSHGILDTDRYHYKTAPHVQTGKRKRDSDGFFTPYTSLETKMRKRASRQCAILR